MACGHVIRVYDRELNFLTECDDIDAAICAWKWNTYGTFEFHFDERLPWMEKDNLIVWDYDTRKNGIIKYVNVTEDDVILKGFSLLWLFTGRLTVPPAGSDYDILTGTPEDVLYGLVDHNAANPEDEKRKIPLLSCRESRSRGGSYKYQTRYAQLSAAVTEVSKASGLGVCIDIDLDNRKLIFEVMEGLDRSISQEVNPRMVFADFYDNLINRSYTLNDADTRNCAYVAGQGEGANRAVVVVGSDFSGNDRKEVFVDARDIENPADLPSRGETKLADMKCAESYESEVETDDYGIKWNLGDLVTVTDEEYQISMTEQVIEVEEDLDENGYSVVPTFGTPEKSIRERVETGSGEGSGGGVAVPDITNMEIDQICVGESGGEELPSGITAITDTEIDNICV